MRTAVSDRIFGAIEQLKPTFGYIRGEDGRQYFFLPSFVLSPSDFVDLQVGMRCCFLVFVHPRGLRAQGIAVVDEVSSHAQTDAQSADC